MCQKQAGPPTPTADPDALPSCHVKGGSRKPWAEGTEGCPVPAVTDELCSLGPRMATRKFFCDKLEPFLLSGPLSHVKCHRSRATGVWSLTRGLRPVSWNKGWTRRMVALAAGRASRQPASARGCPPPEGALAPRDGEGCSRPVWPVLSCIVGDTVLRNHPFTLAPASVPGASQGPSKSRELPLIFGKQGPADRSPQ